MALGGSLLAQPGGNNCAQALANPLTIPFDFNMSTCGRGNNYTGQNGCNTVTAWMNPFGGQDRFFAFTPTESGFVNLVFSNVTATSMVVPIMHIFEGCPTAGGTCIRSVTGNTTAAGVTTIIPVTAGVTYYIVIDAVTYSFINYANCYSFRLRGNMITIPVQPACTNMGFSTGDFTGWFGTTGTATTGPAGAPTPTYNITATGIVNGRHTIMNGGTDPCGGFPRVDPQGGPFSVRLGNNQTGAQAEQLRQTFTVSQSNSSFTYRYAVVFEDPSHSPQDQPFFRALIRDQNGNVVPCSDFVVSAGVGIPGFFNSTTCATVRYKPWSSVNVDLSNYIGQNVTVEFTAGDCSHSGHFGYAYIDAACAPSTLSTLGDTICLGQSTTLTAPVGYASYNWMPGNFNAQALTVSPTQTTTYTLSLTAFNGCVSTYQIPVVVSTTPQASFTFEAPACDQPVQFVANGSVAGGGALSSSWNFGTGASPTVSQQNTVNVSFGGPGTYPVTLTQSNSAGCSSTITQNITVPPCTFSVRITGDTICVVECFTLQAETSFGNGPFQYVWSTGASGSSINVCPSQTTIYQVTVTDSQGNVSTDTAQVTIAPAIQFNPNIQQVDCHGANNGSIQLNPSGFGPFNLNWSNNQSGNTINQLSPGNYSVNATDRFGCPASALFTITQPDAISISVSTSNATCAMDNGTAQVLVLSGGQGPFTFSINSGAFGSSQSFGGLAAGTHQLTVRDANGCLQQQNATVEMSSYPVAIALNVADATCNENNGMISLTQIQGGIAPFSFQLNNGNVIQNINLPQSFNQLEAGNHYLVIRDANNCQLDSLVSIQQISGPLSVTVDFLPATCGLNNASMEIVSVQSGTVPYNYQVNQSDYSHLTHYSNLSPGSISLSVIDSNFCVLDTLLTVPFIPDLSISAIATQHVTCFGGNDGQAQLQIITGSAPFQVQWQNGSSNFLADQLNGGTWTVSVTDSAGCSRNSIVEIYEPDAITATLSVQNASCNQANGVIVVSGQQGGTGNLVYSITANDFSSSSQFTSLLPGSYTVKIRDENLCEISIQATVDMLSYPTQIQWTKADATCDQSNAWINLIGVEGGIASYQLTVNGEQVPFVNFPHQLSGIGQGTYVVSIQDANACMIDTTITIIQFSGPAQLDAQIVPATCDLNNASIHATAIGGTAPLLFNFNNQGFSTNTTFSDLAPGTYQIIVRDSNACELIQSFQVEALENVSANIQLVSPIVCHNDSTGALMAIVNSGFAPFQFQWSNGNDQAMNQGLSSGNYSLLVTDANQCVVNAQFLLTNPEPIQLTIDGPDYVCEGLPVQLTALIEGAQGHAAVSWMNGHLFGDQISFVPDSSMIVTAMVTDALGCRNNDSHYLLRRSNPQGTVVPDVREGCAPVCADFQLNISSPDSIVSMAWLSTQGQTGANQMQKFCFNESGLQGASVTITDFYGCKNTIDATQTVQVYPVPVAAFTYDPNKADIINPEYRFYQQSTDAAFSHWTFGDGNVSFEYEPSHRYQDTGRYEVCLRVTSGFNCVDRVCKKLDVLPFPTYYAPNIFTPNGDGVNDEFKLYFTYVKEFYMEIYNRWGELLFTSADHERGWDGTYKFTPVQDDTYVWKARFRNSLDQVKTEIGRVTLVR